MYVVDPRGSLRRNKINRQTRYKYRGRVYKAVQLCVECPQPLIEAGVKDACQPIPRERVKSFISRFVKQHKKSSPSERSTTHHRVAMEVTVRRKLSHFIDRPSTLISLS